MSFFDSELVKEEIVKISKLQEEIYGDIFKFHSMTTDEKLDHVKSLEDLLQMQQVLYTRLSLSEDEDAKRMKEDIANSALLMGLPANVDMNVMFKNMEFLLKNMRDQIDMESKQGYYTLVPKDFNQTKYTKTKSVQIRGNLNVFFRP